MKRKLWGVVGVGLLCACSADPGYEPRYESHERSSEGRVETPQVTTKSVEASPKLIAELQVCADRLAPTLPKTSDQYAVLYDLTMTGETIIAKVKDSMIAGTELEKCLAKVLEGMNIPDSAMRTSRVSSQSRSMVGVVQAAAAPIALLPIILVAGGFTILLGVTIYVAAEAVEDVIEAVRKNRPKPTKNRCLDAAAGGQYMWYELCRAITDPVKAEGCWALAEDGSEDQKRNWCNGVKF